mgnify:CR=1 FL=1
MSYGETPFLIASAPNGARKTKADLPSIPITPAELAQEAANCKAVGAAMMHLHVRDDDQRHSIDVGRYREMLTEVRASVGDDMLHQVTSEAVGMYGSGSTSLCVMASFRVKSCRCFMFWAVTPRGRYPIPRTFCRIWMRRHLYRNGCCAPSGHMKMPVR